MKEKFVKENQFLFNNLIDAAEDLSNYYIENKREDYLESNSLWDLQDSPLWGVFLHSDYYAFFNQLNRNLFYEWETPGDAFKKLSTASIRYSRTTNKMDMSFDKELFILFMNEHVNRHLRIDRGDQQWITFSYKPAENSPPTNIGVNVENHPLSNIGINVLGLVIGVLGIAAVAIAFTCLNAATGGIGGIVLASFGIAAALTSVGLFATSVMKQDFNSNDNGQTMALS